MSFLKLASQLTLDIVPYKRALQEADSDGKRFGKQIAGYFSAGAIALAAREVGRYTDQIQRMSDSLGVGTTELQELGFVARQNGSDIEEIANAIERISKARIEALEDPVGKIANGFNRLGLAGREFAEMRLETVLSRMGEALKVMDRQDALANLQAIMPKGAGRVLAILTNDIDAMRAAAQGLNQVASPEAIAAVDRWGDAWGNAVQKGKVAMTELMAWLAVKHEGMGNLVDKLTNIGGGVLKSLKPGANLREIWEEVGLRDRGLNKQLQIIKGELNPFQIQWGQMPGPPQKSLKEIFDAEDESDKLHTQSLKDERTELEKILSIHKQIAEEKFRRMTDEQKRLMLLTRLKDLELRIAAHPLLARIGLAKGSDLAQLELERQRAKGALKDLQKLPELELSSDSRSGGLLPGVAARLGTDKIGAFSVSVHEVNRKQLRVQEMQLDELRKISAKRGPNERFAN